MQYIFENGEYYKGFFINSMANGFGIYYYINGDLYEGDFVDNRKHGQGKFICSNKSYFIGQWRNDMQNGYGEYYKNFQPIYKGNLINGRKNGFGQSYENGYLKYEGNFIDDKYEGKGSLYGFSGFYNGLWKSGQKNGHGEELFNEENLNDTFPCSFSIKNFEFLNKICPFIYYYDGNFVDGKKNGKENYIIF